jgi:hypothetical protein
MPWQFGDNWRNNREFDDVRPGIEAIEHRIQAKILGFRSLAIAAEAAPGLVAALSVVTRGQLPDWADVVADLVEKIADPSDAHAREYARLLSHTPSYEHAARNSPTVEMAKVKLRVYQTRLLDVDRLVPPKPGHARQKR